VNDPIRIARQHKMVAINAALQIDLTGQVCADSIGTRFYSGIGGQVDFIRGASMARGGKPIIAVRSTARDGTLSRIVATLDPGAGVVTSRGDVHYVVTEYGVADLFGKSIRDRALSLISIAHPDFRGELLAAAKERRYVFADQQAPAVYPRRFEQRATCRSGDEVFLRPIRATDEEQLSNFFYRCSAETLYKRFMRAIAQMPHKERRWELDVDYATEMAIIVETCDPGKDGELIGIGRYGKAGAKNEAEVAFVIRDDWQGKGLGTMLLLHLANIARGFGIDAFTAEVLGDNSQMMEVFHNSGLEVRSVLSHGVYQVRMPLGNEMAMASRRPSEAAPPATRSAAAAAAAAARVVADPPNPRPSLPPEYTR
jgi:GNAT superfamily N-acetyltransferase